MAQFKMPYNIGAIGNTGTSKPMFTGPVMIDSTSCFSLSNGMKKLQAIGNGVFTSNCQLLVKNETEIKLFAYPNPVVSAVVLKTTDNIQSLNGSLIKLQLFDMQGRLKMIYTTDIKTLNYGYEINMRANAGGMYFINVMSADNLKIQSIKIIKQ